jgi:hypothetical protein
MANRRAQMVGVRLRRDAADLPKRLLDALGQRLEGFAEAHAHHFDIGVREHKMVEQMRKSLSIDRDIEVTHVGEIRLGAFCGDMHLFKDDFPLGSLLHTPLCNVPLQGAHLRRAILAWMSLA